jgi:hypothetical protein
MVVPFFPGLSRFPGFNRSNNDNSNTGFGSAVGNILGRVAQPTYSRSKNIGAPGSEMDELMKRLLMSMGGGGSIPSMSSLEMQARSAVNAQFDPQIAALNRAMRRAQTNASYSKTAVGKLFQGLASSYGADKKDTKKLFREAREGEKARLADYTEETKENYQDSMDSLTEEYKRLGIEAAAGESTIGRLAEDQASNIQAANKESSIETSALGQEETGEMNYWQKGIGTAKLEGTQRQSDIQQMLQEFMQTKGEEIESLKAQREASYKQALAQLQQQVQAQAAEQSNKTWSQLMQLGRFQMDVGRYNKSMAADSSKGFGKGLTGANNYLHKQFVNSQYGPQEGERYSGILQGMILKMPPGITPEQAANYAAEEARRRGISATVMSRAMLAYYGRL